MSACCLVSVEESEMEVADAELRGNQAATKIQALYRGVVARRLVANKRLLAWQHRRNALKIQSAFRQRIARAVRREKAREREVRRAKAAAEREAALLKHLQQTILWRGGLFYNSALVIQRWYRKKKLGLAKMGSRSNFFDVIGSASTKGRHIQAYSEHQRLEVSVASTDKAKKRAQIIAA